MSGVLTQPAELKATTAAPAPIIRVQHLIKRYKQAQVNAVDDISFDVAPGSLFALLGPNGAGKTTTISILTTTLTPSSGSVTIAGYDLVTQSAEVRRHLGIIFQKPSLDLNLTAEENVRFHATLYGLYPFRPTFASMPRAYREQVRSLAAVLGLEASLNKPVKTFSGGMKRKLEIVRSLLHQPEVLFLDEPTSGLDPDSRASLWDYLRQVRAESGTTVFLTTHYLEEAEEADQVCIINAGHIVASGTPDAIKADLTAESLHIDTQRPEERERLRVELTRLGLPFSEAPAAAAYSAAAHAPHFTLPLAGRSVQAILKAIETPLGTVRTHAPTLEDAYLAIVRTPLT